MSSLQSREFHRLIESLDAPAMSAAEAFAFDEAALAALNPAERALVESLVVSRLDADDENPRLVEVAATLQTPGAFVALRRRVTLSPADATMTAVMAAYRLWVLQRDPHALDALASYARAAPAPSTRQAAANALKDIPGDVADKALIDALGDAERSIRSIVYESLVVRFGLVNYKRAGGPLFHLAFGLLSAFPSVRSAAQHRLRVVFEGLSKGQTPESLGLVAGTPQLSPALLRFRDSLGIFSPAPKDGTTFDLAALDEIPEGEREYATDLLIGRLDQGYLAAARGLAHLGTPLALAALSDAATLLEPGAMRDAVIAALPSP